MAERGDSRGTGRSLLTGCGCVPHVPVAACHTYLAPQAPHAHPQHSTQSGTREARHASGGVVVPGTCVVPGVWVWCGARYACVVWCQVRVWCWVPGVRSVPATGPCCPLSVRRHSGSKCSQVHEVAPHAIAGWLTTSRGESVLGRLNRLAAPGDEQHVYNRTANQASVFHHPAAREVFFRLVEILRSRFRMVVRAVTLMPTHFHMVLGDPDGLLPQAMQVFGTNLTRAVNKILRREGRLFIDRYQNRVIRTPRYLAVVYAYLAANPVRAGLIDHPERPWPSTHRALAGLEPGPSWLDMDARDAVFGDASLYRAFVHELGGADALDDADLAGGATGWLPRPKRRRSPPRAPR